MTSDGEGATRGSKDGAYDQALTDILSEPSLNRFYREVVLFTKGEVPHPAWNVTSPGCLGDPTRAAEEVSQVAALLGGSYFATGGLVTASGATRPKNKSSRCVAASSK